MKVKDINALREQISHDPREAFTKHQVWLFVSEHNKTTPTVEAIPKADYETRLKADMMAMLDKIRAEIIAKDRNVKAIRSDGRCFFTIEEILEILDKYKTEN